MNGQSAYFVWLNRGKQSLELDIKNTDDLALLNNILASADVFVQKKSAISQRTASVLMLVYIENSIAVNNFAFVSILIC